MKLIKIFPQRGSHFSLGDLIPLFIQKFKLSQYKRLRSPSSHLKVHVTALLAHLGRTCALYVMLCSPLGHLSITSHVITFCPLSWSYQHSQPPSTLLLLQLLKKRKTFQNNFYVLMSFTLTLSIWPSISLF